MKCPPGTITEPWPRTRSFPFPNPTPRRPRYGSRRTRPRTFSVGDKVTVSVTGKVVGIRQNKSWDGKKDKVTGYEVELEDSSVVNIKTNPAGKALKGLKEGTNA